MGTTRNTLKRLLGLSVAITYISWPRWTVPEELDKFYSMVIRVWPGDPSDNSSLFGWTWAPGWLQRHGLLLFPNTEHGIMIAISVVAGLTTIVVAPWTSMLPEFRIRLKTTLERLSTSADSLGELGILVHPSTRVLFCLRYVNCDASNISTFHRKSCRLQLCGAQRSIVNVGSGAAVDLGLPARYKNAPK